MTHNEISSLADINRTSPIGIFDSGIGGLTVLKEIWHTLPGESTIYFGDNGRQPYGSKSHDTIVKYSTEIMRFLESKHVKMIVIACNSASSHAYETLCRISKVPVVEVITPGARQAAKRTRNGKIGIIATRATVTSGVYNSAVVQAAKNLINDESPNSEVLRSLEVREVACPLFASLAEEGWWDTPVTRMVAETYLQTLIESGTDTLVLGCTHYPLLRDVISVVMGENTLLIDSGSSVAEKVRDVLDKNHLMNDGSTLPTYQFYTSDDPHMFENMATPFLGGGRPSGTCYVSTDSFREE